MCRNVIMMAQTSPLADIMVMAYHSHLDDVMVMAHRDHSLAEEHPTRSVSVHPKKGQKSLP